MKWIAANLGLLFFFGVAVAACGFSGYHLYSTRPKPIFTSFEENDRVDPYRNPRIVNRSKDMELAVTEISAFFRGILLAGADAKTEVRYYHPAQEKSPSGAFYGWYFDRMQAYHISPDQTRSPVGNMLILPKNIVGSESESSVMIYNDKNLMRQVVDDNHHNGGSFMANIELEDLRLGANQVPLKDRTITILDDKIYDDGGDDILGKVALHALSY